MIEVEWLSDEWRVKVGPKELGRAIRAGRSFVRDTYRKGRASPHLDWQRDLVIGGVLCA